MLDENNAFRFMKTYQNSRDITSYTTETARNFAYFQLECDLPARVSSLELCQESFNLVCTSRLLVDTGGNQNNENHCKLRLSFTNSNER